MGALKLLTGQNISLRSKRFCGAWEQRKTEERIFGVLPTRKMGRETKNEGGGGEGE